jgi:hypothetical protein
MTQNTPLTVINVTVKPRGELLFASSEDLFGLNIVAPNEEELCARLIPAVKWLFKQNKGMDVDVIIPSQPSDFSMDAAPRKTLEQLVVARAA